MRGEPSRRRRRRAGPAGSSGSGSRPGRTSAAGSARLHRPPDDPGGHGGEDDVRPRRCPWSRSRRRRAGYTTWTSASSSPNAAAIRARRPVRALGGVVHRQPVAVPPGHGGVRLHRVVVLGRGRVGGVDRDRRRRRARRRSRRRGVGREGRVDVSGRVQAGVVARAARRRGRLLVLDHQPRRASRATSRVVGHHRGHDLPAVGDVRRCRTASSGSSRPGSRGALSCVRTASTPAAPGPAAASTRRRGPGRSPTCTAHA